MADSTARVRWTTDLMTDVRGKHVVVTGGNSGLGLISVREFARRGATVTLAARNLEKAREIRQELTDQFGPLEIDIRELDLASLESIRDFSAALATSPIDILMNNAGIMAPPQSQTRDGFETQFGVNHLGHFALTGHLMSGLQKALNPRVVTVSSNAHKVGTMNFENLNAEKGYSAWGAYAQSKLANLLFAFELQRRADKAGLNLTSVAAHPGYSASNLSASVVPSIKGLARTAFQTIERAIAQSAEFGALPQLFAATEPIPGGSYIGPDGYGEWRGYPKMSTPLAAARDADIAAKLWNVSMDLTNVRYLEN